MWVDPEDHTGFFETVERGITYLYVLCILCNTVNLLYVWDTPPILSIMIKHYVRINLSGILLHRDTLTSTDPYHVVFVYLLIRDSKNPRGSSSSSIPLSL